MPLVSVLMPMRNAEPYVRESLESVLASKGDVALEIIVVDDGSTDQSKSIVAGIGDPRVRLFDGPRLGISGARNAALAAACGSIVTWCDADDLYPPERLAWQVRWLDEHPDFIAVAARMSTMTSTGQAISDFDLDCNEPREITEELLNGQTRTSLCTFAVRMEPLRKVGGFRLFFVTAEDIDLQLRLAEVGRIGYEPRSCYRYRLHDSSATHTQGSSRRAFFETKAREFARQRRAGQPDDLQRGEPPPLPVQQNARPMTSGEHTQGLLLARAWTEHAAGRRLQALSAGWRACLARPANLSAWKSLVALSLKPSQRK